MKQTIIYSALCISIFAICCDKNKDSNNDATTAILKDTILTSKLSRPWEIVWGPDNFIWMTERWGRVNRVNPATGAVTLLLTIPDVCTVQNTDPVLMMRSISLKKEGTMAGQM